MTGEELAVFAVGFSPGVVLGYLLTRRFLVIRTRAHLSREHRRFIQAYNRQKPRRGKGRAR